MEYSVENETIHIEWTCCDCRSAHTGTYDVGDTIPISCDECGYGLGSIDTSTDEWEEQFEEIEQKHERFFELPVSSIAGEFESLLVKTNIGFAAFFTLIAALVGYTTGSVMLSILPLAGVVLAYSIAPSIVLRRVQRQYELSDAEIKDIIESATSLDSAE